MLQKSIFREVWKKIMTEIRKSFYCSQLSDNISVTPENYLICHNVPIARTGIQEYLGQELGINDKWDEIIKVYRLEEDVFSSDAISSFEGKPLTDDHPPIQVDVNNLPQYGKGHVQNVHREGDYLVADIMAMDPVIISEIQNKIKRDISCGYDCYYVPYQDGYKQIGIVGNHIALVKRGRAGSRVSIKDGRKESMSKEKSSIFARMLHSFAKDATPEEVEEALAIGETSKEAAPAQVKDSDSLEALKMRVAGMEAKLANFMDKSAKDEDEEKKPSEDDDATEGGKLEEQEKAKANDSDPEEKGTQDEDPDKKEEDPDKKQAEDSCGAHTIDSLDDLKASIFAIKDPVERKRCADALIALQSKGSNAYLKITETAAKAKSVNDSADPSMIGRSIAKRFNPHYKEG